MLSVRVALRVTAIACLTAVLARPSGAVDEVLFEAPLARFGSRAVLDPCPQARGMRMSAHGLPSGEPVDVLIGATITRSIWAMPFHGERKPFRRLSQQITPTSATWVGTTDASTLQLSLTMRSPFVPGDARVSTAPVFYIDLEAENIGRRRRPCTLYVDLPLPVTAVEAFDSDAVAGIRGTAETGEDWMLGWPRDPNIELDREGKTLRLVLNLGPRQRQSLRLVLGKYRAEPVASVDGRALRFHYTQHFADVVDVVSWAIAERDSVLARADLFDRTITEAGLPPSLVRLSSLAFATFASQLFWLVDDDGRDVLRMWDAGRERFATIGDYLFVTPFLGTYWPRLVELLGRGARPFGESTSGRWEFADGAAPEGCSGPVGALVDMPTGVVEAAEWLLFLDDWRDAVGAGALPDRLIDTAIACARLIGDSDSNADGLPDSRLQGSTGPYPPTMVFPDSVAIGVRASAALRAAMRPLRTAGHEELCVAVEEQIERIATTVRQRAWLGDHYGVAPAEEGGGPPVLGGLYPALRGGDPRLVPDPERLAADGEWIRSALGTQGGPRMSQADLHVSVAWNLVRDWVDGYTGLAVDPARFQRYWSAQLERAADRERLTAGGFVDSPGDAGAAPSCRGMVVFDAARALSGLRVRPGDLIGCRRGLPGLQVPLVERADWSAGRVPWIRFGKDGEVTALRNRKLLGSSNDLYVLAEVGDDDCIELDLLTGRAPRLRDGRADVLESGVRGKGWYVVLRGDAGASYRLRAHGLPPGKYVIRTRGEAVGERSAEELREGLALERAIEPEALSIERRALFSDLDRTIAAWLVRDASPRWSRDDLESIRMLIRAHLSRERGARTFSLELYPAAAVEPALDQPDPVAMDMAVEEAVAAFVRRVIAQDDLDLRARLTEALQPLAVRFVTRASADDAAIAGTLSIENRFLPEVSGRLFIESDLPLESVAALTFDSLGNGGRREYDVRMKMAGDAPLLYGRLDCRVEVDLDGQVYERTHHLPVMQGYVADWLLSRVYTYGDDSDFATHEGPEFDSVPREGSGVANWRYRPLQGKLLDLGTSIGVGQVFSAYGHTYLGCDGGGEVELSGEARGRLRIRVNGVDVFPAPGIDFRGGAFRTTARLRPGFNHLLIKLESGDRGWGTTLRVSSEDAALNASLHARAGRRPAVESSSE